MLAMSIAEGSSAKGIRSGVREEKGPSVDHGPFERAAHPQK